MSRALTFCITRNSTVEVQAGEKRHLFKNVSWVIRYPAGVNIHGQKELSHLITPEQQAGKLEPITTKACIASFPADAVVYFHEAPDEKPI